MECAFRTTTHLHNGDPLTARTVHVPAGRPVVGNPPFTWEQSAIDALQYQGLTKWTDWSLSGVLFKIEAYNGFGYRKHGIQTPYLWGGSQHYISGKFASDGQWAPNLTSKQTGAGVILKYLQQQNIVTL